MTGLLQRFPAYTYTTLMQEDVRFLRLLTIQRLGTPDEPDTPEGGDTEWLTT